MTTTAVTLALPSTAILLALLWHSFRAMPSWRAASFWGAVIAYGIARAVAVREVTEAIGASFPYEIRDPLASIGGISLQELAGWAVVSYLAWWIGWRFSLRAQRPWLFLQIAWASLFLGGISWAIEAAAIAARWWHWTLPTASRVFLNVPAIGIVDWFFVGIDFLLPFAAITAPSLRGMRWRYATLLLFPAHFGGHLLPGVWLHVVHWMLVGIVTWLALRSTTADEPFSGHHSWERWIPSAGFILIAVDVALVDTLLVRKPELLQSIAPACIIWLAAVRPAAATGAAVVALLLSAGLPSMLVATAAAAGGSALLLLRRHRTAIPLLVVIALFATFLHTTSARNREDLRRRLDVAIAERDRGNLPTAVVLFDSIADDHPATHVPLMMAAEIEYRVERLDSARQRLERAVEIRQDFIRGYRLLAVIDARKGRDAESRQWALRGLEIDRTDLQLRYLAGEDITEELESPEIAAGMASLAFEVGDTAGARRIAHAGLQRWPEDPKLRKIAQQLRTAQRR